MNRNVLVSAMAVVGAITMTSAWAHLPGRMTGGGSFFCEDPSTGGTQTFTDAGEPGTSDTGSISIMQGGATVLTCTEAALTFGNHQAHRARPR